ncbi:DUF397 domain-containing protein [Streptomyces sp. NPDC095613]|uniref:DUF397 domain-containing protein n=1 Tax=Streptomyces sp. NPDC095613 TaxID=3155540 RepID=UPI0033342D3F
MSTNTVWQKSSFSDPGAQCVEIADHNGGILIRESDDPDVVTTTTRAKFAAFVAGVKAGEFDHFAH